MPSRPSAVNLDTFNRLVSDIYDAAIDTTLWSAFLERLIQSLHVRSSLLRVQDLRSREVGTYITQGLDPAFQQRYKDYYIHIDTLVPTLSKLPEGSIQQTTTLMPEAFFKGEFYNDYALPQGQEHTIGCILARDDHRIGVIGLHRQGRSGNYQSHELALLELLIPHLQRALQINQRMWQLTHEADVIHGTLQRLTIGVILVDATGTPLFLNKQAEAIVAAGTGLTLSKNALRVPTQAGTQRLHKLIFDATRAPQKTGGTLSIFSPLSQQPLSILVTPLNREKEDCFGFDVPNASAAIFLGSAEQQLEFSLEGLNRLYGLTRAEARLATALANGHSMEKIAEQFGVSKHTVRSQLKSCFRKTGTSRQTELVKLMLCTPAALIESGVP